MCCTSREALSIKFSYFSGGLGDFLIVRMESKLRGLRLQWPHEAAYIMGCDTADHINRCSSMYCTVEPVTILVWVRTFAVSTPLRPWSGLLSWRRRALCDGCRFMCWVLGQSYCWHVRIHKSFIVQDVKLCKYTNTHTHLHRHTRTHIYTDTNTHTHLHRHAHTWTYAFPISSQDVTSVTGSYSVCHLLNCWLHSMWVSISQNTCVNN